MQGGKKTFQGCQIKVRNFRAVPILRKLTYGQGSRKKETIFVNSQIEPRGHFYLEVVGSPTFPFVESLGIPRVPIVPLLKIPGVP